MEYLKCRVEVEIPHGDYCRDVDGNVCDFFWESEDGDTGCCLLGESTFIEGDVNLVPKFNNCPCNPSTPLPEREQESNLNGRTVGQSK